MSSNLLIAVLLGVVFLLVSYAVIPSQPVWSGFAKIATHEIGFALIVASTIWVTFDFFSQIETEDHWNDRIEKISKNVFFGVFKKNFPDELIKEANRLVLDQVFIRSGLHVTYTILDEEYTDRAGAKRKFVKLNAVVSFKIKNVANDVSDYFLGIALPNPMIDEMKPYCKVNRIVVKKGGAEIPIALEDALTRFRRAMEDDSVSQVSMDVQTIPLGSNEELEVLFDYNMAKEIEDTELFTTRYPADSVTLTILDRGGTRRVVRARAVHARSLDNDTSPEAFGTYNFKLGQYLLPQQGFLIWWKNVPEDPKVDQPQAT